MAKSDKTLCLCTTVLFSAVCLISSARTGFDSATLLGNEGRYCGLWVLLSCALAYFLISRNQMGLGWIVSLAVLSAGTVGLIGVLNAIGIDPLSFYPRLAKDQRAAFISTIGNINFFGVYLTMILPLAMNLWLQSRKKAAQLLGIAASAIMVLGVHVSRTDSAFLGMQTVFLAFFALSGSSYERIIKVTALWAYAWIMLPVSAFLMKLGPEQFVFTDLLALLCTTHIAELIGVLLLFLSLVLYAMYKKGKKPIGSKKLCIICIALFVLAFAMVVITIVLFTTVWDEINLGSAATILRFDDNWGSSRGFVFKRSLRAFRDASIADKLFGQGIDLARRILKPYDDNPYINVVGVFNDAHCQPLQLLITCGLLGAAFFCGLLVFVLIDAIRGSTRNPKMQGVLVSILGYIPMMCITVTQPILMTTLFALLGFSEAEYRTAVKEGSHES